MKVMKNTSSVNYDFWSRSFDICRVPVKFKVCFSLNLLEDTLTLKLLLAFFQAFENYECKKKHNKKLKVYGRTKIRYSNGAS